MWNEKKVLPTYNDQGECSLFRKEKHEDIKEIGGQSKAEADRTNIKPHSFIFLHLGFMVVSSGLHQSFTFKASFTAHWRAPFRDSDPSIYCLDLSNFLNPCQVLLYPLTLACSCLKNQCHGGNANFSGAEPVPLNQSCSGLWVSDWMNLGKYFPRRPYWNRISRRFSCSIVLFKEVFQNSFALLYHATFHR